MRTRAAFWLFVAGFTIRVAHAWRVPVPSTDGAHYLWMAEAFARGEVQSGFSHVFHPGFALLLSPFVWLGCDAHLAAKLVGAVAGGLAASLVSLSAARLVPDGRAAVPGIALALGFLSVRLAADAYSETLFLPLAAAAVLACLSGRAVVGAAFLGLTFWVRPEALCYAPMLFVRTASVRTHMRAVCVLAGTAAAYPVANFALSGTIAITPKLGFMAPMGPWSASPGGFLVEFLQSLARVPAVAFPALDWVGLPLALCGLALLASQRRRAAVCFAVSIALGWAVMAAFQVKSRFVLSQMPLLLPLVALCWPVLLRLVVLALAVSVWRLGVDIAEPLRHDKLPEKAIGQWLAVTADPDVAIVTGMPRVSYFAGRKPAPPDIWTAAKLAGRIERTTGRLYVVLGRKRDGRRELVEADRELVQLELPPEIAVLPGADRLLLAERR